MATQSTTHGKQHTHENNGDMGNCFEHFRRPRLCGNEERFQGVQCGVCLHRRTAEAALIGDHCDLRRLKSIIFRNDYEG